MNQYSQHMIKRFHHLYITRRFDQDDVALFIISCRDYCAPKGSIREIGDFIAHPKARNRGLALTSVNAIIPSFEAMLNDEKLGRPEKRLPVYRGIGTSEDMLADLRTVFRLCGVEAENNSADDPSFREFLFCVIFLLCKFSLRLDSQTLSFDVEYSRDLSLITRYESSDHPRHYAKLRVIRIRDVWLEAPHHFGHFTPITVTNHIARRFKRGFLCAVPYEADLAGKDFDDGDYEPGTMWPMPL